MQVKQLCYLAKWFVQARFFGKQKPLQSVIFISDKCNLKCKHCNVYNYDNPNVKTFEQIRKELEYCYSLGSRFVDFEGGEPFIWEDKGKRIDDLIDLAKQIGFYSCTITTNAQRPFVNSRADSIWVSLDGIGQWHEQIRGQGTFERLEKNIATCNHKALSANMAINTLNYQGVAPTIEYVKNSPYLKSISLNFHTPFEGTEYLALDMEKRSEIIDLILDYKKKGYPIMNSASGLRKMKRNTLGQIRLGKECFVSNFIYPDGSEGLCTGYGTSQCRDCGFCMAGEMSSVFHFCPDTLLAGFKLRM